MYIYHGRTENQSSRNRNCICSYIRFIIYDWIKHQNKQFILHISFSDTALQLWFKIRVLPGKLIILFHNISLEVAKHILYLLKLLRKNIFLNILILGWYRNYSRLPQCILNPPIIRIKSKLTIINFKRLQMHF
jgi:hypothetical protein